MPTFHDVFQGRAETLRLAIAVGSTSATRSDVDVAIWDLPREILIRITEDIAAHDNAFETRRAASAGMKPQVITPEQAALKCDELGIENRFFRLNAVLAAWIDRTTPVAHIDYIVM
jgi:hypothetical protein